MSRDGGVVWCPLNAARSDGAAEPAWARGITVELCQRRHAARVGDNIELAVKGAPPTATLVYARAAGQPIAFNPANGKLAPIQISADVAQRGLHVQIGLRYAAQPGGAAVLDIRRPVDVTIEGAVELAPEGWVEVDSRLTRTAQSCRERAFRVYLPRDLERAVVMEGPLRVGWLGKRASPLANVMGTGAPLVVRKQPFNCDADLLSLAIGVTDGGILREVHGAPSVDGNFELVLTRAVLPCPDHAVLFWPSGGEAEFVPITELEISAADSGRRWRFQHLCSDDDGGATLVAISFKGRLLGSGWIGDLASFFSRLSEEPQPRSPLLRAVLIRWCEAPVLLRKRATDKPIFAEFAHAYPEAVFTAWLTSEGLPEWLFFKTSFQRRQVEWSQLRALYAEWDPDGEQATRIIDAIAPRDSECALLDTLLLLLAELPDVAGKIAKRWVKQHGLPFERPMLPRFFATLRLQLGLAKRDGQPSDLAELLLAASNSLRINPTETAAEAFVESVADSALDGFHGSLRKPVEMINFEVASQVASFRQYLAQRVLTYLEKEFVAQ